MLWIKRPERNSFMRLSLLEFIPVMFSFFATQMKIFRNFKQYKIVQREEIQIRLMLTRLTGYSPVDKRILFKKIVPLCHKILVAKYQTYLASVKTSYILQINLGSTNKELLVKVRKSSTRVRWKVHMLTLMQWSHLIKFCLIFTIVSSAVHALLPSVLCTALGFPWYRSSQPLILILEKVLTCRYDLIIASAGYHITFSKRLFTFGERI